MDFMNKGFGEAEMSEQAGSLYASAVAGFGKDADGSVTCQMCETKNPAGAVSCSYCGNDLASDEYVMRRIAARVAEADKARNPVPEAEVKVEEPTLPASDEQLVLDSRTKERILGAIAAAIALDEKKADAVEPSAVPDSEEMPTEEAPAEAAAVEEAPVEEGPKELTPEEALAFEAALSDEAPVDATLLEDEVPVEDVATLIEEAIEETADVPVGTVTHSKRKLRANLRQIQKGEGFTYAVTPPPDSFREYGDEELPEAAKDIKACEDPMLRHCLMVMQDDIDCLLHWMRETDGQTDLYDPIPLLDEIRRAEAYLPQVFARAHLCRYGDAEMQDTLLAACKEYILKGYMHCMAFRDANRPLIIAVKNYYRLASKKTKKGGI